MTIRRGQASFTFAKNAKPNTPAASTEAPADSLVASKGPRAGGQMAHRSEHLSRTSRGRRRSCPAAKENFDKGKYRWREKFYQENLTKTPNNLYSLSNLGVVYFRSGKLKAAS